MGANIVSSRRPPLITLSPRLRWSLALGWLSFVALVVYCADRRLIGSFFDFVNSWPGLDKVGHFCLMGGLAFMVNVAFNLKTWRFLGRRWLAGGTLVLLAVTLEEFSQRWLPSRTFDLLDLTADYLGILFFGWLAWRLFGPREQV